MSQLRHLLAALALFGCDDSKPAEPAPAPAPTASCEDSAQRELARLDTRRPVPLLPMMAHHQRVNMQDHLLAVQEIVLALAIDDFAAIETAAGRIGFSEEMGQTCSHMGAGAPGFTEQALDFHHTADTIVTAAREQDRVAVTLALGKTLQACTGCHAGYRQDVVDEAKWAELVPDMPGPAMAHDH